MSAKLYIVYHSGYGHTKKLAQSVYEGVIQTGVIAVLMDVTQMTPMSWEELETADGMIFGAPTYMGGASAEFKQFADASSKPWFAQKWKDKIAAGFTNSASVNGDKFSTISYFVTLAMQHGMVWVGTGMLPANAKSSTKEEINYLGAYTGVLAQSPRDASPEEAPYSGDLETARLFGARVAAATVRWKNGPKSTL